MIAGMQYLKGFVNYVQGRSGEEFIPQLRHISTFKSSKPIESCFLIRKNSKIGRCPSCDLVLDSELVPKMISRDHALIEREMVTVTPEQVNRPPSERPPDHFWVIQDKSMNGIFVNGIRVDRRRLNHGDVVMFGGGGERSVTPLGGKLELPDSEFIFRFESMREPGLNDKSQPRKPAVVQIQGLVEEEFSDPTQAQLITDGCQTLGESPSNSDEIMTFLLEETKVVRSKTDEIATQTFNEANGDVTDTLGEASSDLAALGVLDLLTPSLSSRAKTVPAQTPIPEPAKEESTHPHENETGQPRRIRKRQGNNDLRKPNMAATTPTPTTPTPPLTTVSSTSSTSSSSSSSSSIPATKTRKRPNSSQDD